jgi:uncharacterized membrane protein
MNIPQLGSTLTRWLVALVVAFGLVSVSLAQNAPSTPSSTQTQQPANIDPNAQPTDSTAPGDQPEYFEGNVQRLLSLPAGDQRQGRDLEVKLVNGDVVRAQDDAKTYKPGERIEVMKTLGPDNQPVYYATDHIRRAPIGILALLFVAVAAIVGRGKGLRAVIGMAFSLAVIIVGLVPLIIAGYNPVLVALFGSALILAGSVYFVHGLNWTAHAALIATIIAAALALGLAELFATLSFLSGYGTEEALFIDQMSQQTGTPVNLRGLLIAGMIVGALGALTDSTIAQAAVIRELSSVNPFLSWRKLYSSGMKVGFDHIGSLINTLVLAYAGSALPLFVLFDLGGWSLMRVINFEMIASEIVQALVGSIGLILAVPISTAIAAVMFAGNRLPQSGPAPTHTHLPTDDPALFLNPLSAPIRQRSQMLDEARGEAERSRSNAEPGD